MRRDEQDPIAEPEAGSDTRLSGVVSPVSGLPEGDRASGTELHQSVQVASARRAIRVSHAPSNGVERLVVAMAAIPADAPPEAVVRAAVDALAHQLSGLAVAACHAERAEASAVVVRPGESRTSGREGDGREGNPTSRGGALAGSLTSVRIFPDHAHERVVEIDCAPDVITVHLAGDDPSLEDECEAVVLTRHAGLLLRAPLALARARADATLADVELASLRKQLVQLDKLATFGQIAAGIVHELNNPLTAIVASADLLLRKVPADGTGEDAERLRRIGESANRLLRFARELVTYTRPPGHARSPIDLHAAIDQAVSFCEHELERAQATVERRYGTFVTVLGLPQELVQAFVNLFTNSCHAMPEGGGTITITTSLEGRFVRVVLDDTGHGIAAEVLPHVFRPFFTTKIAGRGTGLGLSIVKSIVEAHDGEVRVESGGAEGNERGARFVLTLPLRT